MKKINFLIKLNKEGKIQVVEPSDEMKKAYLLRAEESLSSAKALLRIGNLKDAVTLAYYAMYHCLLAALYRIGIKCENHAASIIMLKEVFRIDNAEIFKAKQERIDKQYYLEFEVNKQETHDSIVQAEKFISKINDMLSRMSQQKADSYRNKAIALIAG